MESPRCIFEASLLSPNRPTVAKPLDLAPNATACKFRLLDCQAVCLERLKIRILEFDELPTAISVSYAAISYPWRGIKVGPAFSYVRCFHVLGAEEGEPVSGMLLYHACSAALSRGCPYLWIDRLCIIQTSKEDKNWQIRHMYQVYKSCDVCIILPGGLQRVAFIDEPTPWIHRNWTLQETLAPPETLVVFRWRLGPGTARVPVYDRLGSFPLTEVPHISNGSCMLSLRLVLMASLIGSMFFVPKKGKRQEQLVQVSIFSAHPPPSSFAPKNASDMRQRKVLATNVSVLSMAMEPEFMNNPDRRAHAVWQSALLRTSSYPVDMVFSVMGLFGVELDPSKFQKSDRRKATIALARAILQTGSGHVHWLGVACRVPPDKYFSTLPMFPQTSVSGMALIKIAEFRVQELSELLDPVYHIPDELVPFPRGSMDVHGRLTLPSIKSVPVWGGESSLPHGRDFGLDRCLPAIDGSLWQLSAPNHQSGSTPDAYLAVLGSFYWYYPGWTVSDDDTKNIRLMLLEDTVKQVGHSEVFGSDIDSRSTTPMFYVRSYVYLDQRERGSILQWPGRQFFIAGSEPDASTSELESTVLQNYYEESQPWPVDSSGNEFVRECIRVAQEARPYQAIQEELLGPPT